MHAAWFMLGLLELFEGHVNEAIVAWKALDALEPNDALRLCAHGLFLLVYDEIDQAAERLRLALQCNTLNPALNEYMSATLKSIEERDTRPDVASANPATHRHLLLAGYASSTARH
ncbi:hypothetical protein AWB66_00208 [Caballeronia telluris]|uniref:Uncharacterized protein n=1 Tax=Caballeronia telluris TaxID=326475 RepID=A0A158ESP1_9BURK|nr:hypothetical protein AWB66_00208 [Caballeronia telluris]